MVDQSIKLQYHQEKGLLHTRDIEDLRIPQELKEETKKNAKKITKLTKKYRFRLWFCLLIPAAILILILSNTLTEPPISTVGTALGVLTLVSFFIIPCILQSRKEKGLQKCFEEIDEETSGVVRATPNYQSRTVRTKNGTRVVKTLVTITYSINQARLSKYYKENNKSRDSNPANMQKLPIQSNPQANNPDTPHLVPPNPGLILQPKPPHVHNPSLLTQGRNTELVPMNQNKIPYGPHPMMMPPVQQRPSMPVNFTPFPNPGMHNPAFHPNNFPGQPFNPPRDPLLLPQPNPNILDHNYNGPMNPNMPGNKMNMGPMGGPNLPAFVNDKGKDTMTYGVDANQIDDYSAKQKF